MRRLLPLLFFTAAASSWGVTGCGGNKSIDGSGGGGSSTSDATTSASGAGGGDVTGTGGGGAAPIGSPRQLTIVQYDGAPAEGVAVLAHDASGELVDRTLTSAQGIANVTVPDDGMLTLAYSSVLIEPEGSGEPTLTLHRRYLRTLAEVGASDTLTATLFAPQSIERTAPLTLNVTANVPDAQWILVHSSCDPSLSAISPVGQSSLQVRGCPGATTVDVTFWPANDLGDLVVGHKTLLDAALSAGTMSVSVVAAELEPPTSDFFFAPEGVPGGAELAVLRGLDSHGRQVCDSLTFRVGGDRHHHLPPCKTASAWTLGEYVLYTEALSGSRFRRLPSAPLESTWVPTPLLPPEKVSVIQGGEPGRPDLTWSWASEPSSETQALVVGTVDPYDQVWWEVFLPKEATSFRWPTLPDDLEYDTTGTRQFVLAAAAIDGSNDARGLWAEPHLGVENSRSVAPE